MGDGGWEGGCNRWCVVTSHYLTGLDSLEREKCFVWFNQISIRDGDGERNICIQLRYFAVYLTYLPTYLMHNVGTSILLIFFLFFFFTFFLKKKESSKLALKFSNLTLQPNPIFFLQY